MKNKKLVFYIKSAIATLIMTLIILSVLAFGMIMFCVLIPVVLVIFIAGVIMYVRRYKRFPKIFLRRKKARIYNGTYHEHK